jgi:hypothetical protein
VSARRGRLRPHYAPPLAADEALFRHYLRAVHGAGWPRRIRSWLALGAALARRTRSMAGAPVSDQPEPK